LQFKERVEAIDNMIEDEITDAEHVLLGLAITISQSDLHKNPPKMESLAKNFDREHSSREKKVL